MGTADLARGFDHWTDATLVAVEPEGAVQPLQKLHFVTAALGWKFAVTIDVLEVDAQSHRLHLHVHRLSRGSHAVPARSLTGYYAVPANTGGRAEWRLVGEAGFEPATPWPQPRRPTPRSSG